MRDSTIIQNALMKLVQLLLEIFVPPVGVFLTYGVGPTLMINILLTLLDWLPGSIHAVWAIAKHNERLIKRLNPLSGREPQPGCGHPH